MSKWLCIRVPGLLLCATAMLLTAQQPTSADGASAAALPSHADLPPSSIYTETLAPAEAVHADIGNWSDVEIAAYTTAMVNAKAECHRLEQTPHEGEEALAMAKLCSLGQDWDGTYSAARWYTRVSAPQGEAPHLSLGFGLLLQADLSVPNVRRAFEDLKEMNSRLPLSADTDSVFTYAIHALEVTQPEAGVQAALLRQPALLSIAAGDPGAPPALSAGAAEAEAWHTLALLYETHQVDKEQQERNALQDAISRRASPLPIAETYVASRSRLQYEWLGKQMPSLHAVRTTYLNTSASSAKAASGALQLLVIEREGAADIAALSAGVDSLRLRLQPPAQATLVIVSAPHPTAAVVSTKPAGAHALFTDSPLIEQFAAGNGPLFVTVDPQNQIDYLGTGATAWLNPQMQAELLLSRVKPANHNATGAAAKPQ